jgi:hypothetical protein
MKKHLLVFSSVVFILLTLSCSSGKKAFERGDYYNATMLSVNRLRSNPKSSKAIEAVKQSYPMAIKYLQGKADYALSANTPFKFTETVTYYESMNRLSDEISRCPAALNLFPSLNYYTAELSKAKQLAAEEQYLAGVNNEKLNTRLSWKEAYLNYQKADLFIPGYKNVKEKMDIALYNATFKVVVEQIRVSGKYQLTSDFFLNQIIENLAHNRPNPFVEYYSPESAKKAGIKNPDQLLRMSFDDFIIGQVYDKETVRDLSRDSVQVGTVTLKDGKKVAAYNTVKAKLKVYRREVVSNGVLDVTIVDLPVNRIVTQKKFPGEFVWFSEWGSFNGDERALNERQLAICKGKPIDPPGSQDLFIAFTKPIFNQVTPFLKSFYQQY